jgi:hypothetical protein
MEPDIRPLNTNISPTSGIPTKINWDEAREYFVNDPKSSLVGTARHYNVAVTSVARWAKKQNWMELKKEKHIEQKMEIQTRKNETKEDINERHLETFRQMQTFVKSNLAIANDYIKRQYNYVTTTEKAGTVPDKRMMYSAQNVKYIAEALKIAIDGERVALGMPITSPGKTEKDIKVSGAIAKFSPEQINNLFNTAGDVLKEDNLYDADINERK